MLNKMEEVWKDIEGYEGLYQISDCGRVRSLNYHSTGKPGYLKPRKSRKGYLRVVLCKNGDEKSFTVHRLVANAFLPNPGNLPQINHKDEIKTNNCVSNLEWCTNQYNQNYGSLPKRHRERMLGEKNTFYGKHHTKESIEKIINNSAFAKKVICVETGITYKSTMEAQRQTGIPNSNISACCRGKYGFKTAGGYHWKYTD